MFVFMFEFNSDNNSSLDINTCFDEGDDNAAFYLRVNPTEKLLKIACYFLLLQTMFKIGIFGTYFIELFLGFSNLIDYGSITFCFPCFEHVLSNT